MDRDIARILLISDDSSLLLSLNEILTRAAFQVSVSIDADDALPVLSQDPPELVMIDHHGRIEDALDVLRRINEGSAGTRVILLSNRSDWAFYEDVQKLGGDLLYPRKLLRPLYILHAVDRVVQGTTR